MSDIIPISDLTSGYVTGSNGEENHQNIKVGDLAGMMTECWGDKLKYNLITLQPELDGVVVDPYQIDLLYVLLSKIGWTVDKHKAIDAFLFSAQCNSYNPIKDYLNKIENDTTITPIDLGGFASEYFGTTDPLYDEIMKCWFVGLVMRVFEPGCKYDDCLTLRGGQGIGKSTFFKIIAGAENFNDTPQSKDGDLLTTINSCWIYEFAELEATTSKKAVGSFKALLSSAVDQFRKPFMRTPSKHKRSGVICASVNESFFLKDDTGSRRVLVIDLSHLDGGMIDLEKIKADRDRILKTAILEYRKGTKPYLTKELEKENQRRNLGYKEESVFFEPIQRWLRFSATSFFTTQDAILGAELRTKENINSSVAREASKVLRELGCVQDKNQSVIKGMRRRYWRTPKALKKISDESDQKASSDAPKTTATASITSSSSQISDKNNKINTTHRQPPKAIRCEQQKLSESSEQLANFFDGAIVSTSQEEIKTESI